MEIFPGIALDVGSAIDKHTIGNFMSTLKQRFRVDVGGYEEFEHWHVSSAEAVHPMTEPAVTIQDCCFEATGWMAFGSGVDETP
jgi:hypothetical protein